MGQTPIPGKGHWDEVGSKGTEGKTQLNPAEASASAATWQAAKPTVGARLKAAANWVAEHELWLLAPLIVMLLFSNNLPFSLLGTSLLVVPIPWLCRWASRRCLTRHTALDLPIIGLLLMALVGLYPSVEISESLRVLYKMIVEMALFYGLVNGAHSRRRLWTITGIVLAAGTGAACLSLVGTNWSTGKFMVPLPVYRWLPSAAIPLLNKAGFNGNIVGGTLAMILPLNLALFCFGSKRGLRPLLGLSLLIVGITLLLTQSRGGLMGFAAALVALAIWRSRWFVLLVPLALIGIFVAGQYFGAEQVADFLLVTQAANSAQGRVEIWQRAIYMLQDFPFTGIGLGTFYRVASVMYPFFLIGPDTIVPEAHNVFLQTGVDLGIPGLVSFIAVLTAFSITALEAVRMAKHTEWEPLAVGLSCGFVVYLIHGLVDAVTFSTKPGTMIWTILGLTTGLWWYLRVYKQRVEDEKNTLASLG